MLLAFERHRLQPVMVLCHPQQGTLGLRRDDEGPLFRHFNCELAIAIGFRNLNRSVEQREIKSSRVIKVQFVLCVVKSFQRGITSVLRGNKVPVIDARAESTPPGVGQWIKDRSKTSYELRRYAGTLIYNATRDILKVRDFLRHASVETTQQWYTYLLEDVPSIGMNDFVPSLHTVSP